MPQRHAAMPNRMEKHNAKHNVLIIIIDNKLNCQHFSAKYRFRWIIVALSARHTDRNYVMAVNLISCISFHLLTVKTEPEWWCSLLAVLPFAITIAFAWYRFTNDDRIITNKTNLDYNLSKYSSIYKLYLIDHFFKKIFPPLISEYEIEKMLLFLSECAQRKRARFVLKTTGIRIVFLYPILCVVKSKFMEISLVKTFCLH